MTITTSATNAALDGTTRGKLRLRRVFAAGALAAASSAIAVTLYALVIRALGVPMRAGFVGAASASRLEIGSFAMGAIICTFWGTLIATALSRFTSEPRKRIVQLAVALTAISFVVPLGAADTADTTKIALVGAHLLAALIVIPALARGVTEPVNRHVYGADSGSELQDEASSARLIQGV